ncbi:hypothetical protein HNQ07_004807 [Deinococcus metalli]|uniref:Sce7726 family protein n=1 Tax=Deinococcus metalli TaxID=1141878 RepID=A0A7W8KJH7_9DEIO|nr:sce7726 family protein [Deinococcus metalli]MBB5379292.1 hypothetical protein [Deinococcus metalli]
MRELTLTHPEAPEVHVGRADLAILTPGFTCGYEIKTAQDKLTHLPAQLAKYAPQFDAWHLAVATGHVAEARTLAPTTWGLIELKDDGTFAVLRAAHTGKGHFNVERLLWTLTGEDLLTLYQLFYTRWPHKTTRAVLIKYLLKARPEQVLELALRHIRTRGHLRMQSWKVGGHP